jgi:YVTN family beta-propeller protein
MNKILRKLTAFVLIVLVQGSYLSLIEAKGLKLQKNITDSGLTPKSVVHAGKGLFFAQNMMYNHNISVYNRNFERIKIINDAVDLSKFGFTGYQGTHLGAPVECAFSHDGQYAWVSNYQMYGKGFNKAGVDNCKTSTGYDHSFLYKINTQTLAIENVVQVGCVPKYVAVTPDSRYVLVSNWCSGDVTVVDSKLGQAVKSISMGAHPRGIVVDSRSEKAYIAVMGSSKIGVVNLSDFSVSWLPNVGYGPRHLCISPDNAYLYVTLNSEGKVAKLDLRSGKVVAKVNTGNAPRSMAMLDNGAYLYVVNYLSNTLSKIRAADMKVVETIATKDKPIGITTDAEAQTVWVACYSGNIMVFQDTDLKNAGSSSMPIAPLSINVPTMASTAVVVPNPPAKPQQVVLNKALVITKPLATVAVVKTVTKSPKIEPVTAAKVVSNSGFYIIIESCTSRIKAQQTLENWKTQGANNALIVTDNVHYRIASNYYKTKADALQAIARAKVKYAANAWIWEHS